MVGELPPAARDTTRLVALYRAMALNRAFDQKAVVLQRSGRLGTYASSLGEEAVGVGVGAAMAADDVLVPSFRDHGAQLLRGVTMTELFLFWSGDERGSDFAVPREDFPVSIPVGSHAPHAAGVALALKLKGGGRAALCLLGDGATSKGDFYEAINIAGVWRLPIVFVVANNQWAISVPRARQTAAETIAQKAWAAGFDGVQVDGNDVIAVYRTAVAAVKRARAGGGPTLIECRTFRWRGHVGPSWDTDVGVKRKDELTEWIKQDPIPRCADQILARGVDRHALDEIRSEVQQEIDDALHFALHSPFPQTSEVTRHVYCAH